MSLNKQQELRASYKLSPLAKEQLQAIWSYGLRQWGVEAADSYYRGLFQAFENISMHPFHFQQVDFIRKGYRRCPHKSHVIYYRIVKSEVQIMAILGRQSLDLLDP